MRFDDQPTRLAGPQSVKTMEHLPEQTNMRHLFLTVLNLASRFPGRKKSKKINNSAASDIPATLGLSGFRFYRAVMLFCMIALLLLSGSLFGAEKHERKVVRIPVFAFDRMMVLDEDKNPISGYAYEYIQTIGAYAGWDVDSSFLLISSEVKASITGSSFPSIILSNWLIVKPIL